MKKTILSLTLLFALSLSFNLMAQDAKTTQKKEVTKTECCKNKDGKKDSCKKKDKKECCKKKGKKGCCKKAKSETAPAKKETTTKK